ncbi:MAG TPA: class I SAM-dependent methyltransferase [Ktedonosporobacter sp.]|jgi:ubiquinone/menaquinone biosynthesis C-methylase UbiE|nr:class I SAM-dependent methyltransferase [Ktedonosporobacter sp.]
MSQPPEGTKPDLSSFHHPRFAAFYERQSGGKSERRFFEPLRREVLAQAHGVVLEVGAGTGLNFALYEPEKVTQVEAVEPDSAMLAYARNRLPLARVPLTVTQATAEALPFADRMFDCVVATLVFCSVGDPVRGFVEIRRVLKPGGTLLLLEHVRSTSRFAALLQDLLVPLTTRMAGNCHWNRDTAQAVNAAGFQIQSTRIVSGWLLPMLLLQATRPEELAT